MGATTGSGKSARRLGLVALLAATILASVAGGATASTAQEERRGSEVLRELEAGRVGCADVSSAEFEQVGEYVMGRMLASAKTHESMDDAMARMMGAGSEARVHEAMGRRFTGCGDGRLPAGFGRMMGAFNAMGMMGGGMMGNLGPGDGPRGPSGSMMGGPWHDSGDDDGPGAAAAIAMLAVLLAAAGAVALLLSRRRPHDDPVETLKQRFARGELSEEDYRERLRLLRGG